MLPYTSFVSHHRFSFGWFYNWPFNRAFLCCLSSRKLFEMVTVSRPLILQPVENWKFYFHRKSRPVILTRSRSYLVTVRCHNSPATLLLCHYNAQDRRVCWFLDTILHRFYSSGIHRSLPKSLPSDRSPFPCHSNNNLAFRRFCHAFEVTSPICHRISPEWKRWRFETTYGCNPASIHNTSSLHSSLYHYTPSVVIQRA